MSNPAYARAFAKALFGAAQEAQSAVAEDVAALKEQWYGSQELRNFCQGFLATTPERRARRVADLWQDSLSPTTLCFLKLLAQRKQLVLLPTIITHYQKLYNRACGAVTARITFAATPTTEQVDHLRHALTKKHGPLLSTTVTVDPKLIAGLQLFIGDQRIDASLAGRLKRLRTALLHPTLS